LSTQLRSILDCFEWHADSDDLARVYRFDLAQDSEMISPTIPILCRPGREAFWLSGFWHRRSRVVNLESRFDGLVFLLLLLCCGNVGNALRVVQA
jgi:hypothetical protein